VLATALLEGQGYSQRQTALALALVAAALAVGRTELLASALASVVSTAT
jgi:hypothetical protein